MKIAVTSQNRQEITGHAGRCRKFWVYEVIEAEDTKSGEIKGRELVELSKEQSLHEHRGPEHPILDSIQVLITGGMGEGMRQRLTRLGIRGIITPETDPDTAVRAFLDGSLIETPASSHGHTDHHNDHGCGCSHQEVTLTPSIL